MAIRWNEALATGLAWQDEQHQELFQHLDNLLEAMRRNEASEAVGHLFDYLDEYTVKHFGEEEAYMLSTSNPMLRQHSAIHQEFRGKLREFEEVYKRQGASSYLVMRLQRWLHDWLFDHISRMDKQLAAYAAKPLPK